jgi:hypothetical protein
MGCYCAGRVAARHAAGTIEAGLPVRFPHVLDPDLRAGAGRMDELAIADIDADMAERAPHGVEEHQITRLEVGPVDGLGGRGLFVGTPGQNQTNGSVRTWRARIRCSRSRFQLMLPPRL